MDEALHFRANTVADKQRKPGSSCGPRRPGGRAPHRHDSAEPHQDRPVVFEPRPALGFAQDALDRIGGRSGTGTVNIAPRTRYRFQSGFGTCVYIERPEKCARRERSAGTPRNQRQAAANVGSVKDRLVASPYPLKRSSATARKIKRASSIASDPMPTPVYCAAQGRYARSQATASRGTSATEATGRSWAQQQQPQHHVTKAQLCGRQRAKPPAQRWRGERDLAMLLAPLVRGSPVRCEVT